MTQPIDPTQWPKVIGRRTPEAGVYFVVGGNGKARSALPYVKGEDCGSDVTLYGPITFAVEKNMPQAIDLSHFDLSKIEAKKQPDKPGVWWVSGGNDDAPGDFGLMSLTQEELDSDMCDFAHPEYRYLCDFIPPKQSPVIPPLPTVTLYAVEQLGVVKWCHKSEGGFWTADGLQAFGDPDAVPIAEKVVTVTE